MDRSVIIRPFQQITSGDGNNIQEYLRAGMARFIQDAFGAAGYYTGFQSEVRDVWKVRLSEGRLYVSGQAYAERGDTIIDLYGGRPFNQKKIVTIIARGSTVDSEPQPRKFLKNAETRETYVETVAMLRTQHVIIETLLSAEAAAPVAPQASVGTIKIAEFELTPGGVGTITMAQETYLPNAARLAAQLADLQGWRSQLETRVGRIATDLYTIGRALSDYTPLDDFLGLREELIATRRIADKALALANEQPFLLDFVENFTGENFSDLEADGYAARITGDGLEFPRTEESIVGGLQLQTPNDPQVTKIGEIITPKATARTALDNSASFAGSVALLAYTTTKQTVRYETRTKRVLVSGGGTRSYERTHYSGATSHYSAQAVQSEMPPGTTVTEVRRTPSYGGHDDVTYRITTTAKPSYKTVSYTAAVTETNTDEVNAQGRAQTFIVSSGGRLSGIALFFDQIDVTGDVRVMISEADGNNPDQTHLVTQAIVSAADLATDGPIFVPLPPAFLDAGKRYAWHVLSSGNHRLRLSGQPRSATQGEHFAYIGDNAYIRPSGEAAHDIAFRLDYQQYNSTKVEVMLQPIEMAGGMDGVQIEGIIDEPAGTNAYFEVQVNGQWQALDIVGGQRAQADFSGRPNFAQLRLVFEGTLDKMPSCHLGADRTALIPFRDAEAVKHVSQELSVGGGSTASKIKLSALMAYYIESQADCTLSLIVAGQPVAATSVEDVVFQDSGEISRTATFELATPAAAYQAVIEGAAINTNERFVVERLGHYAKA